jgi:predicted O-methyltransferase YrrM
MVESDVLKKIHELEKQRTSWFVNEQSLKIIMQYIRQGDFHNILEIGTNVGYSALNFSLIANNVTTIEKDPVFLKKAKTNCQTAKNIQFIEGDALVILKQLMNENRKYHGIFIDAHKASYARFLKLSIPLLENNGAIFIDNTISHKDKLGEFFVVLTASGLSYKELNVGDGLIIAFKTRKFFQQEKISPKKSNN